MATGVHLTDGTYLPRRLQNDECKAARECVCGFCKGELITAATVIRQCDYGSCTNRATRTCARYGYPICDDCARIAARTHPAAYASDQPPPPKETVMTRSELLADMSTRELHDERRADLLLTTDHYAGTDRVKEYHADRADRISDELDSRHNA